MSRVREDSLRSTTSMNKMPAIWEMVNTTGEKDSVLSPGTESVDAAPRETLCWIPRYEHLSALWRLFNWCNVPAEE